MLLDEVVFEQQRFGVGVGDRHLDVRDLLDEREGLRLHLAGAEVAADAIFQAARLADVQQLAFAAVHAIDARSPGERGDEVLRIEVAHRAGLASSGGRSPRPGPLDPRNISGVSRRVWVL